MIHGLAFLAIPAFEEHAAGLFVFFGERRKVDAPKVDLGSVYKGDAVRVDFAFGTDAADDADQGLFVGVQVPNDDLLLGGELIGGNNACTVATEKDSLGHFGKALAIHVASGQKDSEFLWDAAAAAEMLVGHVVYSSREEQLRKRLPEVCQPGTEIEEMVPPAQP